LLADDCPDQGRPYLTFLQQAEAEVTLECNVQSAIITVRESTTLFDVVLMNFHMPKIGGT